MSKCLYELSVMMKEKQNYDNLSKRTSGDRRVELFQMRNKTAEVIEQLVNAISPNILPLIDGNVDSFYSELKSFIKGSIFDEKKSEMLEEFIRDAKTLDASKSSKEQQEQYRNIRRNPIYKRSMGHNAINQIAATIRTTPELKSVFGITGSFNFDCVGNDVGEISETFEIWGDNLQSKLASGIVTKKQCDYFSDELDYLEDFYISILNGEQPIYESSSMSIKTHNYQENKDDLESFLKGQKKESSSKYQNGSSFRRH